MLRMYLTAVTLLMMQPQVIERHFLDIRKKYGAVIAVDLINKVNILSLHNDFLECYLVIDIFTW